MMMMHPTKEKLASTVPPLSSRCCCRRPGSQCSFPCCYFVEEIGGEGDSVLQERMMSLKKMMLLFGVTITPEEPNKNTVVVRRMHNGHRSKDAIMVEDIPAARAEERVATP
jgi:hypothetical protein